MSNPIDYSQGIYDAKKLGTPRLLILGAQHMFAMFGATVLVPLLTAALILLRALRRAPARPDADDVLSVIGTLQARLAARARRAEGMDRRVVGIHPRQQQHRKLQRRQGGVDQIQNLG